MADIALEGNRHKQSILRDIAKITELGMSGKLSFAESLQKRLRLIPITDAVIQKTIRYLKKNITPSLLTNIRFFRENKDSIYVVSGGFTECIVPITTKLGIDPSHVYANTFIRNAKNEITGYYQANPLAKDDGKVTVVRKLHKKNVVVIGDGFTDLQITQMGAANRFVAFVAHSARDTVTKKADEVVRSFDEFLYNSAMPMTVSYPKSKIKVVLLENINNLAVSRFEKEGYRVEWYEKSYNGDDLDRKLKSTMIVGIRSRTQLSSEIVRAHPTIRAVGAYCIGTNQIDIPAAASQGIAVFNAPYGNTRSVVELALGEMIMLMRHTVERSKEMHTGVGNKTAKSSHELRGKVLGIIGYGNIGSQL